MNSAIWFFLTGALCGAGLIHVLSRGLWGRGGWTAKRNSDRAMALILAAWCLMLMVETLLTRTLR